MDIGLDVHKRSVYLTQVDEEGKAAEQYEFNNTDEEWTKFRDRYLSPNPKIALEISTTGKYIARMLRDMGFDVHIADPVKMAEIYKTSKKNDKEDSLKLAKRLRMNELPEVHLPSRESDDLRSLVRYRRSIGRDVTMAKNRIHATLTSYGILIDKSDVFGVKGMKAVEAGSSGMRVSDRIVLSDLLSRLSDLKDRKERLEDEMSRIVENNDDAKLLMTIPGINVYSAVAIISEIDDISRFKKKESFANYAGLIPNLDESAERKIQGHISKHGPSMLRFILVNCAHTVVKYSVRFKKKYNSIVRRLGKSRAIVAIARILAETIYTMLSRHSRFVDEIDSLTEKKIRAMEERAKSPGMSKDIESRAKILRERGIRRVSDQPFS